MDGGSTEDAGGGSIASLGDLERWRAHSRTAALCIVFFGSLLLNATLLVPFIRRPGLRTISNRFVMNLIAANLLGIFVLTGLLITGSCDGSNFTFTATPSFCALSEGATALVTTSSILSVLLIALDQYLAVVDPLRYRTRIDKLKCALLILAVWLVALLFGGIASLNPQPRGLWHLCSSGRLDDESLDEAPTETELRFQASLVLNGNATENADLEIEGEISFQTNAADLQIYNATSTLRNSTDPLYYSSGTYATYGLVYALVYALLGYLVPFLAIFWIYVSIYMAARSNSERTRRNGSRPILSSGSFSEEGSANRQDTSVEDFRRIPKISSLSSIDENSESSPSQTISPLRSQSHENVHYREAGNGDARETGTDDNAIIFTVGSTKIERNEPTDSNDNAKESTKSKVPISALKTKFLLATEEEQREPANLADNCSTADQARSKFKKFPDVPEQRRKSSHDIMYEEMMLGCEKQHPYEYDIDDSSDEDDEAEEDDEDPLPGSHEFEEALPLSATEGFARGQNSAENGNCAQGSTRSISVNFDLSEAQENNSHNENSIMLGHNSERQNNNLVTLIHPPPIVTITPPGQKPAATPSTPLHRVPSVKSTNSYINNLKYRISNGSLFKYREETRAARISVLVIVMGLICWTPYVYVLLRRNLSQSTEEDYPTSSNLDATALGFLVLATYVSPLLFGYRSRRVKRELRKFFCFKRELSYKNNRSLMAKKVLRRRHSGATILGQFVGDTNLDNSRYNIFNCVYGRNRWPKEKVQFVQVPETALAVETCRSSFSSGASTQISSTSTDEC